jgi:uncharacterized protein YigA (DUF484 family)
MSSKEQKVKDTEFEQDVLNYLCDHPVFFEKHQDVLAGISLSHETGSAVSLIERQVQILREQKEQQEKKLQSLINAAQNNEKLNNNVNGLILALLDASTLSEVLSVIDKRIRTDFDADAIVVKLLASGNDALKEHEELTAWQQPALVIGEKVMTARQPLCGSFNTEQMQALFDDADIQSAGIVPLVKEKNSKNCYGIIAIGSYDPQRFRSDMGTLFLSLLGQVLTRILKRHLDE